MIDDQAGPTEPTAPRALTSEVAAAPGWEVVLAECTKVLPGLDTNTFPSPLLATVPMFVRHACAADTGGASPGLPDDDDYAWMPALAGGIEGGLRRLAASKAGDAYPFLLDEAGLLVDIKQTFGPVFKDMAEPQVRAVTTWGERKWPDTPKDQVALLAEYLAKDPDVVPALIAVLALGVRSVDAPAGGARKGERRVEQAERALGDYFARRGSRTYCDLIRETAIACHGPGFGIVTAKSLKIASYAIKVGVEAAGLMVTDLVASLRAHDDAKAVEAGSITELKQERDRAVAAARKEGMAASAEQVRALEARVRELEGQLDTIRIRVAREKAYAEQQRAKAESEAAEAGRPAEMPQPATPPPVVAESVPVQRPSLEGRRVFLFTSKTRGGAREAFRAELESLGASEPRVYDTKGTNVPGPNTFPPRSVVIVDTSFMSHSFSEVISRRARAGEGVVLVEDRLGVGGLEQRLANAMRRQAEKP